MNRHLPLQLTFCAATLVLSAQLARAGVIHGHLGSGSSIAAATSTAFEVPAVSAADDLAKISDTVGAARQASVTIVRAGLNEASAAFGVDARTAAVSVPEPSTSWMFLTAITVGAGCAFAFRRRSVR